MRGKVTGDSRLCDFRFFQFFKQRGAGAVIKRVGHLMACSLLNSLQGEASAERGPGTEQTGALESIVEVVRTN